MSSCVYPSCMMGGGCSYEPDCVREEKEAEEARAKKRWNIDKEMDRVYDANRGDEN